MEITFRACHNAGMEDDDIGSFIRRHRNAARMTQKELGQAIGISDRTVSEWESGRGRPGRDAVSALAGVFRVSADELLRRLLPAGDEIDQIIAAEYERRQGHGPERARAARILEDLIDYPELWEAWMLHGEYLLTRRR